jgi:hypothetical protein
MSDILAGIARAIRDHNPEKLPAGEYLYQTPAEELRRLIGFG